MLGFFARHDPAHLLKSLPSFVFVASDSVMGRGITRFGNPAALVAYYQGGLGGRSFSFTIWPTADGKIAYLRFTPRM